MSIYKNYNFYIMGFIAIFIPIMIYLGGIFVEDLFECDTVEGDGWIQACNKNVEFYSKVLWTSLIIFGLVMMWIFTQRLIWDLEKEREK